MALLSVWNILEDVCSTVVVRWVRWECCGHSVTQVTLSGHSVSPHILQSLNIVSYSWFNFVKTLQAICSNMLLPFKIDIFYILTWGFFEVCWGLMLVTSLSNVKLENKIARLIHLLFMVTILRGRNEPEIIQSLQEFAEIRLNSFNQFRGRNGFLWKNTKLSSQEEPHQ